MRHYMQKMAIFIVLCVSFASVYAAEDTPDAQISQGESIVPVAEAGTESNEEPYRANLGARPKLDPEPEFESETQYNDDGTIIQNAVLEGVQVSAEPGDKPDEKVVSCYFIFRDKPSSYFYEIKQKEKLIVFEFNDTKVSPAPIPSSQEPPILGFSVESKKINVNKDIKGLRPEYHDQIKVIFKIDAFPEIKVNDEFNIITFSYKWTTDSAKIKNYLVKNNTKAVVLWSSASVATIGAGVAAYFLLNPPDVEEVKYIDTIGLPMHPAP